MPLRTDEDQLTQAILALAGKYGRYGNRRITVLLRDAGWLVGKDRVRSSASEGRGESLTQNWASNQGMQDTGKSIFDEQYTVIAVKSDRLLVKGIFSGEVLTIINNDLGAPLRQGDYPPGKLIALTDPSTEPLN